MKRTLPAYLLSASLAILVVTAGLKASDATHRPSPAPAVPALLMGQDVEAIVDHRKGIMRAASGHLRATAAILVDGLPFEAMLPMHGSALAMLLSDIPALYPEGSNHEESEARPEIWQSWDVYVERAGTTAQRARALEEAIQGGNRAAMVQAFRGLGETCGACHEDYRN
ncbi:MAG: cytochrome c [Gemmatimonadales bacterium]|nr:MAG: cytochrome c [Gemmatimonadales bacterium]